MPASAPFDDVEVLHDAELLKPVEASTTTASAAPSAAVVAAKARADAAVAKREALLRQVHLHVQAFLREEGHGVAASGRAASRGGAAAGGIGGDKLSSARSRRVTAPGAATPLQVSFTRLVQQLRRQTVQVVEAIVALQDVSGSGSGNGGGSGGVGRAADTGGSPATGSSSARVMSSSGGAAARMLEPRPMDDYLQKMMHDTDMVCISTSMVRAAVANHRPTRTLTLHKQHHPPPPTTTCSARLSAWSRWARGGTRCCKRATCWRAAWHCQAPCRPR